MTFIQHFSAMADVFDDNLFGMSASSAHAAKTKIKTKPTDTRMETNDILEIMLCLLHC